MNITKISDLKEVLELKNEQEKKLFDKTVFLYELLEHYHSDISNLNVNLEAASILYLDFHADFNTVVSTLIYRIIKRLNIPDREVLRLFNEDIKDKVKLLSNFDADLYSVSDNNRLQMIKSLTRDVKVTIIKLIERVTTFNHMKKREFGNKTNFVSDTLNFYVPISKLLGIYKIKNKLEDACFKYNNNFISAQTVIKQANKEYDIIIEDVYKLVESENIGLLIAPEFKINKKSGYDIIRKASEIRKNVKDLKKEDINSLGFCSIKCLVTSREDCYRILYLLHKFKQILGTCNDYIGGALGNEYRAIHTTVFIKDHVVDFRICTKDMDYVNYYGITSSWEKDSKLQKRLMEKYDFYPELISLEESLSDEELVENFVKYILEAKELKGEYLDLNPQKFLIDEEKKRK